ncbi:MAG: glycosyltransferase family 2 protein [Acidobacteriota bacterium]
MRLSIVIVNWNTGDLVRECVLSVLADLQASGISDAEVIIVDNASSDDAVSRIERECPGVRVVQNDRNLGFAQATNQGIRLSSGRFVLLLNPDTVVRAQALGELLGFLESRPEAGAVGPWLLNGDGSLQISAYPEPTLFREAWRLFHLDRLRPFGDYPMQQWDTRTPRQVDVLTGACLLVRREVFERCGLLDEAFFIFSEDQDFCRRLRSSGWKLFWVPSAQVVHYGGQSSRQVKTEMFLRLYREKVSYFRKHHGGVSAVCYKLILVAAALLRQVLAPLSLLGGNHRSREMRELARHYRLLVRALPTL